MVMVVVMVVVVATMVRKNLWLKGSYSEDDT
jgi:hypothetical protein